MLKKMGNVRVDFRTALESLALFEVDSVFDKKNGKSYYPGGPDGDEPYRELSTTAEEYKCEIEVGSGNWWQADLTDPAVNAPNPSSVAVNANYRSEVGWKGTFTVQYYNGSTLVASINLPVNGSEGSSTGKGQPGVYRWDFSPLITTRSAVAGGRLRLINKGTNGKKVWATFSNLEAR